LFFLICFFKGLFLMVSFAIDILLLRSGALLLFFLIAMQRYDAFSSRARGDGAKDGAKDQAKQ